ncbi:hypothetical protein AB0L63_04675 [Nocardia sp. NPDC051990]|uniref:hypothetical protein n=1 Tax=Nocardia sp. NPDC051990 TaxID=3155285 RepID=UPI003419F1C4
MTDPLPTAHRILDKTRPLVAGQSVRKAIVPIAVDHPPTEPLATFAPPQPTRLSGHGLDPDRARRLDAITAELVDSRVTGR